MHYLRRTFVLFLLLMACKAMSAETKVNYVRIDLKQRYQVLEGFGQGNMEQSTPIWYAKYTKEQIEGILDTLYTLKDDGLGLNICRYPIPIADAPGHNHMNRLPKTANKPFEYEDGKFNWEGHEDVFWLGKGAADRGALMWASWYGVPYWLSVSGCAAGSVDGKSDNLQSGKEERFIKHILDVMKHFRDEWGIKFDYVCPINEPEADWWKAGGGQPGSHVSSDQAIILYRLLETGLKTEGMSGTKIIAYDAAYATTADYLKDLFKAGLGNTLDVLACHQYVTSGGGLKEWASIAARTRKSLWMSEWGDWTNAKNEPGMELLQMMNYAGKLHEAFDILQANAWVMWEAGFIFNAMDSGLEKRKSYWAVAHYSRHLRPGTQRAYAHDSDSRCKTTTWISPKVKDSSGRELIFITVNQGEEAIRTRYPLSAFAQGRISEVRQTCPEYNYKRLQTGPIENGAISVDCPGKSVTTVVASMSAAN